MQKNELTTEAMLAKIDLLENKVDRLEWENKGIAEWQGEYSLMKANRDRAIEGIVSLTAERDALTSDNAGLHTQLERWQGIAVERAKERDAALEQNTELDTRCAKLEIERDFLAMANKDLSEAMNRYQELQQAAKLALEALDEAQTYAYNVGKALDEAQKYTYNVGKYMHNVPQAIETLKQAGVQ